MQLIPQFLSQKTIRIMNYKKIPSILFFFLFLIISSASRAQVNKIERYRHLFESNLDVFFEDSLLKQIHRERKQKVEYYENIKVDEFIEIAVCLKKNSKHISFKILNAYSLDSTTQMACNAFLDTIIRKNKLIFDKTKTLIFRWFLFTRPILNKKYLDLIKEGNFYVDKLDISFDYRDLIQMREVESNKNTVLLPIRMIGIETGLRAKDNVSW